MLPYQIPVWKTAPFSRLLLAFIIGILLQWYFSLPVTIIVISFISFLLAFMLYYFFPLQIKFRFQFIQGILMLLTISGAAMFITWQKDIRHHPHWFGHIYNDSSLLIIRINEPLIEKFKSYKAEACAEAVINNSKEFPAEGNLFIYFSKDSTPGLHYGDRILVKMPSQRIKNAGNPGAFNYERYAAFQQTFHTIYLRPGKWILLSGRNINPLSSFIFSVRSYIVYVLHKYMSGNQDVLGIAEALLIGYKEDLDKDLVQAYSNAGVVHIIAISGLHLGLIYVMLAWIFLRLPFIKDQKLIKVILILSCLWLFSLLTGASASVLRSAVMFTCIVIGKHFFKQASIYNSLAASAFILLGYNPFFLWDVGFQLSYLAVIGIVVLQKPVESLLFLNNSWLKKLWNMLAITIAAQVLTFPICIYYFHQFPNLFFITNMIAVPLSTVILFAEIFLITFSWLPVLPLYIGKVTGWLVWLMNSIIRMCNGIPFSLLDNIFATFLSTAILYCFVISICAWLMKRSNNYFYVAMISLTGFTLLYTGERLSIRKQKKIIIYNIPQRQAIDFIYSDQYCFYGDSSLRGDALLKNFHLKPARMSLQVMTANPDMQELHHTGDTWQFFDTRMIILDTFTRFIKPVRKIKTAILLISKNPAWKIKDIAEVFEPSVIVFDASNSMWKIAGWEKECLALALPCFSIPEKGAFIFNIDDQPSIKP